MKVRKLSVSFDPELGDAVRGAADRARQTLSGWLAEAAAAKLRADALGDFLDSWEAEHGVLTAEELAAAATRLHIPLPSDTRPTAAVTARASSRGRRRTRPPRATGR